MPDAENRVVAFPTSEPMPTNPMVIDDSLRPIHCGHAEVSLDTHNRVVNCQKCGATLDPFNFLATNARTIQSAWSAYRIAEAKARETHERVVVLQKELKRLQGRVRTLQQKEAQSAQVLNVRGKELL